MSTNNYFIAQKLKEEADRKKAIERNTRKYHTAAIEQFNNMIIANDGKNWQLKLVIYSDKSAGLDAIARPGSGCDNCHYCGTDILKSHLQHLRNLLNKNNNSIIPDDWQIIEPDFFRALNII